MLVLFLRFRGTLRTFPDMSQWREQFGFWGIFVVVRQGAQGGVQPWGPPAPGLTSHTAGPELKGSPGYLWAWVDTVVLS